MLVLSVPGVAVVSVRSFLTCVIRNDSALHSVYSSKVLNTESGSPRPGSNGFILQVYTHKRGVKHSVFQEKMKK